MSIFNRRNAFLGWLSWLAAKYALKRAAKDAVPGTVKGTRRPNKGAIAAGIAAVGGLLWLWRRNGSDDEQPAPAGE